MATTDDLFDWYQEHAHVIKEQASIVRELREEITTLRRDLERLQRRQVISIRERLDQFVVPRFETHDQRASCRYKYVAESQTQFFVYEIDCEGGIGTMMQRLPKKSWEIKRCSKN